ncbi:MAG TPA: glycosyltransferase family 4 protein [Candidatus Acidoferrum sp.]|nr:glycosyltransferase family 4 protein [Candidatus Acidoferrum sp.]
MARVGLVTTSYPRFPGDPAGCFVAEHAAFLARAGHEVEVIAAGSGRTTSNGRPEAGSIRVHRVPAAPGLFERGGAPEALARGGRVWLSAARFSLALAGAVARRAPAWDAAVAHWLVPSALAALASAPRLPLLAIAHSGDVHLLRRLHALRAMGALCARREVRLSFVSEELRRLFLDRAPGCAARAQVCSMGIDLARLEAVRAARTMNIPPAGSTVLFLGRLVPVKGVDVLVRAAVRWRSGARLVIAGAGPAEPPLRKLAALAPPGRIYFAGQLLGAERDRALAAADIVALPSVRVEGDRSEGLPLVALEAMAVRAALVASSVGGLAELPPAAATLVKPGDVAALATAVDRLILDRSLASSQIAAQDRLIPSFDWDVVGPRLLPPLPSRRRSNGDYIAHQRKGFRRTA